MSNRKTCDCGSDQFHALMGIEQRHAHPGDPRAPDYREVVEQIECVECGATYSA